MGIEDDDLIEGSPPSAPQGLEVSGTEATTATLKWKEPRKDGGAPIKEYFIEFKSDQDEEWQEGPKIKPKKLFSDLRKSSYANNGICKKELQDLNMKLTKEDKYHKNTFNQFHDQNLPPLLFAKRTKVGPDGQPIGSVTSIPQEVDQIARDTWDVIFNSNVSDLLQSTAFFLAKYAPYLFRHDEVILEPVSGVMLYNICKHANKKSVGGMDGWSLPTRATLRGLPGNGSLFLLLPVHL